MLPPTPHAPLLPGISPEFCTVQQSKGRSQVCVENHQGPAPALGAAVPEMFWMWALSMAVHTILSTSETTSPPKLYAPRLHSNPSILSVHFSYSFAPLCFFFYPTEPLSSFQHSVFSQTISSSTFTFFSIKSWSIASTSFSPTLSPFITLSFYHICSVKFKLNYIHNPSSFILQPPNLWRELEKTKYTHKLCASVLPGGFHSPGQLPWCCYLVQILSVLL